MSVASGPHTMKGVLFTYPEANEDCTLPLSWTILHHFCLDLNSLLMRRGSSIDLTHHTPHRGNLRLYDDPGQGYKVPEHIGHIFRNSQSPACGPYSCLVEVPGEEEEGPGKDAQAGGADHGVDEAKLQPHLIFSLQHVQVIEVLGFKILSFVTIKN